MEGFSVASVPDESERVDDVAKAQEMAEAGDRVRTRVSGRHDEGHWPGLKERVMEANASVGELRNDPGLADSKRGHLDNIHVREYVADDLSKQMQSAKNSAERAEEIAGIVYDLQHPTFNKQLSPEAIQRIKEIIKG